MKPVHGYIREDRRPAKTIAGRFFLNLKSKISNTIKNKKVTEMPIGLGMNHLEHEIAVCQLWNATIAAGVEPAAWMPINGRNPDLFSTNRQSGDSLLGSGFIEVSGDMVRLTQKDVELIEKFISEQ